MNSPSKSWIVDIWLLEHVANLHFQNEKPGELFVAQNFELKFNNNVVYVFVANGNQTQQRKGFPLTVSRIIQNKHTE